MRLLNPPPVLPLLNLTRVNIQQLADMQSDVYRRRSNSMFNVLIMLQRYVNAATDLFLGQSFFGSSFA